MGSVTVLVGASVVTFLLILLFWKLGGSGSHKGEGSDGGGSTHVLLQVLLLGFILAGIVLIGKASLDDSDKNCEYLINTTSVNATTNTTSYSYAYTCTGTGTTTGKTFYGLTVWILRLVGIYVLCYLIYVVLVYFGYLGGGRKGRDD